MQCSQDASTLQRFIEKDPIYDFLAGINVEFDDVRVHILVKVDLPSLNETASIIQPEERRKSFMLETRIGDGSALAKLLDTRNQGLHSLLKALAKR